MKLSETANKLIEEFGEAVIDLSREQDLDAIYKLAAKRQALEEYIRNLEAIVLEK